MRNVPDRFFRLGVALTLALLVASQIPVTGVVALAQNGYPENKSSDNNTGRNIAIGAGVAAAGYGIYYLVTKGGIGGSHGGGKGTPAATPGDTVWDVANKTSDLKQVASLVEKVGMKESLRGAGPFTMFAPTNDAFGALDSRVLQDLKMDENKAKLAEVLGFHVVRGAYTLDQLRAEVQKAGVDGFKLTTTTGKTLIVTNQGVLRVNGVPIVEAPISATNGVIHPISSVLIPQ